MMHWTNQVHLGNVPFDMLGSTGQQKKRRNNSDDDDDNNDNTLKKIDFGRFCKLH